MTPPQRYAPQALHVSTSIAHHKKMAEDVMQQVEDRMGEMVAYRLAPMLLKMPGGAILTPLTWTINDDDKLGITRIAGTINVLRLPDPADDLYYLEGGRMHGRFIRLGANPPLTYLIPWVPPVATVIDEALTPILEYRRVPGAQAYQFVREL